MNQKHLISFIVTFLLIMPLLAYDAIPLRSNGSGKTTHPVLFIHGRFSDAAKTFDVKMADEVGKNPVFSNFSFTMEYGLELCPWDGNLIMKHHYIKPHYDVSFDDGREIKNGYRPARYKVATRTIPREDYTKTHLTLDGVQFNQANDVAVVTYTDIGNPIDPGKKYTVTLTNVVMKGLSEDWHLADLKNIEWEGKAAGEFEDNYRFERDLVMHYMEGSTPDVIADELNLNVSYLHGSPNTGINSNGLYFFNSKIAEFTLEEPEVVITLNSVTHTDSLIGPKKWPDGVGEPYEETFYSEFRFDVSVTSVQDNKTETPDVLHYADSVTLKDWKFPKPDMRPTNISVQNNIVSYDLIIDGATVRRSFDVVQEFGPRLIELAGFDDTIYAVTKWNNDPVANAYWNENYVENNQPSWGQPNQLIQRMTEVMNDFYGEGAWEDDPTKVIDLVTNSMGGTTARFAIAYNNSNALSNPINHINRIVSTGAPHKGSPFSTRVDLLDPTLFGGLIELKSHLLNSSAKQDLINIAHVLLPNEAGIFLGTELDIHLDLKLSGKYLGPFDVEGGIYWNHFSKEKKFVFDNSLVEKANESMQEARAKLLEFDLNSQNLAIAAQSPYTQELSNMNYPVRYSDGSKIEITNFYIDGVDGFLQRIYTALLPQMEAFISREFHRSDDLRSSHIDPDGATKAVVKAVTEEITQLKQNLLDPLDQQWSHVSDIIVNTESQKGINPATGFVTGDPNTPFYVKPYTRNRDLAHMKMDLSKISGGEIQYRAGAHEGTDIAGVLLDYTVEVEDYPRDVSAPATGYLGRSSGIVNGSDSSYLVTFNLVKGDGVYYNGPLSVKYFVKADPSKGPQLTVLSSGGMSFSLDRIGGELYAVTGIAANAEFNRGGVFPNSSMIQFKLSYADGTTWNPGNDWSCYGSETISENSHIVVWDSAGVKMSGLEPDYANDTLVSEVSLQGDVVAYSKERSYNSSVTQPSLSIKNNGDTVLTGFHAYYYVTSLNNPEMKVFWMAEQSKANWELRSLNDSIYVAHIQYEGINVAPGGTFNYIDFEINNIDWSIWNFDDDPSYIDSRVLTQNDKVVVTNLSGDQLWGTSPFVQVADSTPKPVASCYITAREEATASSLSTPRIRLFNDGETTLHSLRIYYYFTTEGGKEPVLQTWDVPKCDVNMEHLGGNQYRIIYRSSTYGVEPGTELPNMYGSLVGLHYADWSTWNSSNDYSHTGLGSNFIQTDKIVVEDGKGNVLWGVHPQ